MTNEKVAWLIQYWETAAKRSEELALKVSGEGEAAEIYRDTAKALRELSEKAWMYDDLCT